MPTLADVLVRRILACEWPSGLDKLAAAGRVFGAWFEEHGEAALAVLARFAVSIEELRTHELARFVHFDRRLVGVLVERGWYPDPRMALAQLTLLSSYRDSEPDAIEEIMREVFRERLDGIEAKLADDHPQRAAILREAFEAHRQSNFNLSVPVLLAQADGIWRDRIDRNLFSGGTEHAIQARVAQVEDANSRELVLALNSPDWPLAQPESRRPEDFSGLNRHLVLHGQATDYGTEENSLRAIAFLNYCAFVLAT